MKFKTFATIKANNSEIFAKIDEDILCLHQDNDMICLDRKQLSDLMDWLKEQNHD